jgi:broad-specificity NMP kinase
VSTDAAVILLHALSLQTLYDRLEARGYADKKLQENMECEIMQVNDTPIFKFSAQMRLYVQANKQKLIERAGAYSCVREAGIIVNLQLVY